MWVKVLPANETKEPYFTLVSNDHAQAREQLIKLVHGPPEVVKTQALMNAFGFNVYTGMPEVVMVINGNGQRSNGPINERASRYYPNEYDIKIRGDVVLTGWAGSVDGYDIASMPLKWKVIHDMETVLAESGNDYEKAHSLFDDFLLQVVDEDVAKMYKEAREQFKHWPTA